MLFVKAQSPTYFAPVTFATLGEDGQLITHKFDAQFKRLTRDEATALDDRSQAEKWTRQQYLEHVMVGWRGVQAGDPAQDLPFTPIALQNADNQLPGLALACLGAWRDSVLPVQAAHLAAKN